MSPVEQLQAAIEKLEQWVPIPGYETLYEISDSGRVRSLSRIVHYKDGRSVTIDGRYLSQAQFASGHLGVMLYRNTTPRRFSVHRLVLLAFVGPGPDGAVCRHLNDNPADNRLDNLRWGTVSDNMRDRVSNGRDPNSRKTHCPQGHEYTTANTQPYRTRAGNVGRQCRECNRARGRQRRLALALAVLGEGDAS